MRPLLILLALLAFPTAASARLSPEERRMASAVTAEQDRTIALLERLVNRNSGSLNLEGVRAIGQMMREELEPLGFEVRWVDMAATGRAGHLVATHRGPGRNVLLIGHLDTVFETDSPFQHFTRTGNRATGPGVGDDKGGLVVIVAALRAMHAAGTLRTANVTIVLTGDEERTGSPIAIARRDLAEPNLTYNVGVMAGGTPATLDADGFRTTAAGKTNVIAETAIARGDLRSLTPEQDARARERMQAIVAQHLPRTSAELVFGEDGYPPMAPTEGNRALLGRLNGVNRDLGLPDMPEYDPARRGAADSSFVAADVDKLAGLGAAGGGSHAEGEWVDLDSLPRQATRAAILITRLTRERPAR
jgi:acetylornithine deacetylase/succinyl-diaminopimelate desuccinylase-like protein